MRLPVRSMTGFARIQREIGEAEAIVTLKSLNHRGLDLHFHMPPEFESFENSFRAAIKRAVLRGHLDVRIVLTRRKEEEAGLNELALNQPMLNAYMGAFRQASAAYGLTHSVPDLNMALGLPGMFATPLQTEANRELEPQLAELLEEALASLNEFRAREGAELAGFIRKQNQLIADACGEIERIRSRAMPLFQQRFGERLKELLRNSSLEPQRLAQEAALLADRSDVGEELTRLNVHSRQLHEILDNGGEVGKKLDFLLQEMNRETNTILSKTNGIGELGLKITDLALAVKADIEKIREQALNLE